MSTALALLPDALRAVVSDHESKARTAADAAATDARAALAAFVSPSPALEKARAATLKARAAVDTATQKLRDAEQTLGQAAATEAMLAAEEWETRRRLRRAAVAPWRLQTALETVRAAIEAHEHGRMTSVDAAVRRVYLDAVRVLQAVQSGDADAPADLTAWLDAVHADAEAARATAKAAVEAARVAALTESRRTQVFGAPLT
ncbi:MAG: hypothetical protein MUF00_08660 [Gemmatimonadaceae bacterium]|jgi:hypothetical protein|nr:hypothetical protein [Gemmatimonadaceae bacterium]